MDEATACQSRNENPARRVGPRTGSREPSTRFSDASLLRAPLGQHLGAPEVPQETAFHVLAAGRPFDSDRVIVCVSFDSRRKVAARLPQPFASAALRIADKPHGVRDGLTR